ncbi:uncharacterized protein LOC134254234 [Saccostrea cucullata]|uniref:uncharacterized protein LOC134254234 n=1 Tax=Saccostrea cuccullata TaxID=36930 RepID=UPI002ED0418F
MFQFEMQKYQFLTSKRSICPSFLCVLIPYDDVDSPPCINNAASVSSAASLRGCVGQIFQCFVSPCEVAKCSYPNAHCVADYCNGCNAVWYHGHIKLTTEQCAGTTTPPPF